MECTKNKKTFVEGKWRAATMLSGKNEAPGLDEIYRVIFPQCEKKTLQPGRKNIINH